MVTLNLQSGWPDIITDTFWSSDLPASFGVNGFGIGAMGAIGTIGDIGSFGTCGLLMLALSGCLNVVRKSVLWRRKKSYVMKKKLLNLS